MRSAVSGQQRRPVTLFPIPDSRFPIPDSLCYSHVGCVRDGKPLIFRLFAPGTGRPVTHHQSTPYSLLPTPDSLCYRLYS
ncbi:MULTISPECIES: hypothetical protein [unclassified Moorena]|uniref:hypothetical protein n=1 Tax=unclassified Moorena TaxID=2683338 RepID=UPI00140127E3|nr:MULTISPECIES: hypothetical protein [unclassified Moorena]NEO12452.1 hypothetical protein [Moorena sp. SIO3E8]NEP99301.1 hypothetical protein [Moorena sp. SIO3F7]